MNITFCNTDPRLEIAHLHCASVASPSGVLLRFSIPVTNKIDDNINTMDNHDYCAYIMTNKNNTVLYTGVTNDLYRRVTEHKSGKGSNFTSKYKTTKLIYYKCGTDIYAAIDREKQIKGGSRQKKEELINNINPDWKDLFEDL